MKKVGLKAVAAKAGVSVATVSYVMTGQGRVSSETRNLVLQAADDLGFVRNEAAANLRSGQSRLIGVILNNIANPFFSSLVSELEMTAYREGFLTLLATAQNDRERQGRLMESMVSQAVGAIILSPVHDTHPDDLKLATMRGIPIISCVRDLPDCPVSFVGADDERSGYLAGRAVIRAGGRVAVLVGGYERTTTHEGRSRGVTRAFAEAGLPRDACTFRPGPITPEYGVQVLEELVAEGLAGRAVICFNDGIAMGVYEAAQAAGLAVGVDLSVISFDNARVSSVLTPGLTTVDIFPGRIGAIAAERAAAMARGMCTIRTRDELDPVLIERHSII